MKIPVELTSLYYLRPRRCVEARAARPTRDDRALETTAQFENRPQFQRHTS